MSFLQHLLVSYCRRLLRRVMLMIEGYHKLPHGTHQTLGQGPGLE